MRSSLRAAACAALLAGATPAAAQSDERVAFIVGNSEYRHAPQLRNPANDAGALAATFARLGYQVVQGRDLSQQDFVSQARSFFQRLEGIEVAVFFYAGHGLQIEGRNFMIPVDFDPNRSGALTDQLVLLDSILEGMSRRARHSLVFLDACRDNPFAGDPKLKLGGGRGLAEIKGRVRTLIAFATQPGNIAMDGDGANSPFTTGLLKNLEEPGLEVRELLTKVRVNVVNESSGAQIPWDHSSLLANFYIKKRPRRFAPPP